MLYICVRDVVFSVCSVMRGSCLGSMSVSSCI